MPAIPAGALFGVSLTRALLLVVLCIATLPVCAVGVEDSGGGSNTVKILNLLYSDGTAYKDLGKLLTFGVNAALFNASRKAGEGRMIELVYREPDDDGTNVTHTISAALKKYPDLLAILGPLNSEPAVEALSSSIVKNNSLVCLSPFTGSRRVRYWSKNAFFMRADPHTELVALLHYIILELEVNRVGLMHLTGVGYGDDEYNAAQKLLKQAGFLNDLIVYTQPHGSEFNLSEFEKFANRRPQAILFFGDSRNHTTQFIEACLTSNKTMDAVLLGPSANQPRLIYIYHSLSRAGKITPRDGQVITSGTNLLPTDLQYNHIRVFREQMTAYHAATGEGVNFSAANANENNYGSIKAEGLVAGWIAGSVVAQLLQCLRCTVSREAFQRYIFTQTRFVLYDDLVLGDYGGECSLLAKDQGVMCECNQGGRAVYIKRFLANNTMQRLHDARYSYPRGVCYGSDIELKTYLNIASLSVVDQPLLFLAAGSFLGMKKISRKRAVRDSWPQYRFNLRELRVNESTVPQEVLSYTKDYRVYLFTGPTTVDMPRGFVVINPVFKRPRLNAYTHDSIVEVVPTLEQQFFVVMRYVSERDSAPVLAAAVRGLTPGESAAMLDVLNKTAATVGVALSEKRGVCDGDELTLGAKPSGPTLLVGLDRGDVQRIAVHLRDNTAAHVFVSYQDFSLHYDAFVSVFKGESPSVQARLLTTTNLPLWSDTSSEAHRDSKLLSSFHAHVEEAHHTPSALETYVVIGMALKLATLTDSPDNPDRLLEALYANNLVTVYDRHFGPYERVCNSTAKGVSTRCAVKNYGARRICVLSMARVLNRSVASDYPCSTPDIMYATPDGAGERVLFEGRSIVGIVVGCTVALVVLALCVVWVLRSGLRSNDNAPKDAQRPVTLIFTDIESSTALWATLPQLMPNVVAAHHRLIREVIAMHGCYEVKTVGDSFMIACGEAYAAVQVACGIQHALFRHDWGTCELDRVYRELEMRRCDEKADYDPPTATLPCGEYGALWNGLRVRIGVHTGVSDIRHDEVTKGFDYYGDTSNVAARTEAIGNGGQILLTEWTWWALSHTERASLRCTAVGPQRLRGVEFPVEMYQLNSFPGRRYAELRTEIEASSLSADNRSEASSSASGGALSSAAEHVHGAAAAVAAVLTDCFSAFTAAERVKGLRPLLLRWNISVPHLRRGTTEEDYCRELISRLAAKMSLLAELRHRLSDVDSVRNPLCVRTGAGGRGPSYAPPSPVSPCGSSVGSVEIALPPDLAGR